MKPKIWNDITNILAKLAGSEDYDPRVKYDTSLEYYGNQIPVLPRPASGSDGKYLGVQNGKYKLSVPRMVEVDITDTDIALQPADNTQYNCGTLGSLTITSSPASGSYVIVFTSGATATTVRFPGNLRGLEDFAPETNTIYEINVMDNRAVVGGWAVQT